MKNFCRKRKASPPARIPGVTRQMVEAHATRLFRDILRRRPLTPQEWAMVEHDLAHKLERDGF